MPTSPAGTTSQYWVCILPALFSFASPAWAASPDALLAKGDLAGLVFFIIILCFVVGGIIVGSVLEKRRRQDFQRVAGEHGFEYTAQASVAMLIKPGLELFTWGRSPSASNLLQANLPGVAINIFDYRYVTGSGKNRSSHLQTVALFVLADRQLPAFALRPENFFHRIGSAFGYQDIDFSSHPKFSQNCLLRGPDESAVRELFSARVLEYFENQPDFGVEAAGSCVLVYRHHHRVKPENIPAFLATGLEVLAVLGVPDLPLLETGAADPGSVPPPLAT